MTVMFNPELFKAQLQNSIQTTIAHLTPVVQIFLHQLQAILTAHETRPDQLPVLGLAHNEKGELIAEVKLVLTTEKSFAVGVDQDLYSVNQLSGFATVLTAKDHDLFFGSEKTPELVDTFNQLCNNQSELLSFTTLLHESLVTIFDEIEISTSTLESDNGESSDLNYYSGKSFGPVKFIPCLVIHLQSKIVPTLPAANGEHFIN